MLKMVSQELINYIKTQEDKGFSKQQLKSHIVKYGYSEAEVEEAFRELKGVEKPQSPLPTQGNVKRRNPFLVLVLSFITLGIYNIIWLVLTSKELRRNVASAPNPKLLWILLIPIINFLFMFYYYYKYCKALNEFTGFSTIGSYILFLLINPVGMVLAQLELNKKA